MLVRCRVATEEQWADAAAGAPDAQSVVHRLAAQPAWWSADEPALTPYLVHLLTDDEVPARDDDLRVDRFLVRDHLGKGGMGVVLKAWDLEAGRFVALKRTKAELPLLKARFLRETSIQRMIEHRGVARFYDFVEAGGECLLVMEYLNGQTLTRAVRDGHPLPWRDVARWARDLLEALDCVAGRGIVHRDIKPSNVMLCRSTGRLNAKLLDLGLAKCRQDAEEEVSAGLTRQGVILGSCEYMSPEQWRDSSGVGPAGDVYSLGGTLFFALAGHAPYHAPNPTGYLAAHLHKPVPDVKAERPDVPAGFAELIARMMAKRPADRGTPSELLWQLGRLARAAAPPRPAPAATPAAPAKSAAAKRPKPPAESPPRPTAPVAATPARPAPSAEEGVTVGEAAAELTLASFSWLGSLFGGSRPAGTAFDETPGQRLWRNAGRLRRALWRWVTRRGPGDQSR